MRLRRANRIENASFERSACQARVLEGNVARAILHITVLKNRSRTRLFVAGGRSKNASENRQCLDNLCTTYVP
jgi:hypothetical protein